MSNDELIRRYQSELRLAPPAINERTLWFEAGRASVAPKRSGRWLRAYATIATATAASLAGVIVLEPAVPSADSQQLAVAPPAPVGGGAPAREAPAEPPVSPPTPRPPEPLRRQPAAPPAWLAWLSPSRPAPPPDSYVALRDRALRAGLDPSPRVFEASLREGTPGEESPADGSSSDWAPPKRDITARGMLEELLPPDMPVPPPPAPDQPPASGPEASQPTSDQGGLA
ncbi:hypothetical protein [Botrimarina sp.]|uniref:hypothetical protein n=1 Tax=Botrimarina sp. TaxID=2795802 RepID=UPI0032EBAD5E